MAVSYSKLWKMLIDKKMMKKDLQASANLTQYVMRKLSKDEAVTTDTLAKICCSLDCSVDDIMDIIPEKQQQSPFYGTPNMIGYTCVRVS